MTELFDNLPEEVPIAAQVESVRREVGKRERCYPRWVTEGRISQALADRELARMRAVLRTLEGITP